MTKEFILGLLSKINGAKDRAGELPGGACFMDGDTVLCLERARGDLALARRAADELRWELARYAGPRCDEFLRRLAAVPSAPSGTTPPADGRR